MVPVEALVTNLIFFMRFLPASVIEVPVSGQLVLSMAVLLFSEVTGSLATMTLLPLMSMSWRVSSSNLREVCTHVNKIEQHGVSASCSTVSTRLLGGREM